MGLNKADRSAIGNPSARERFEFGENWSHFLLTLDEARITQAVDSLKFMLGTETLADRSFLDVGSGSGLFSLAAVRLGAKPVHSFDYDPKSVACTRELKQRFAPRADYWTIEPADVLNQEYLANLGQWDIVYSWGVLHHTGDMWKALEHAAGLVAKGGILFISIYNDQGWASRIWKTVKHTYNRSSPIGRRWLLGSIFLGTWGLKTIRDFLQGKPFASWRNYDQRRGMSPWIDMVDWVGGWPFEVAKPELIFDFYHRKGFTLEKLKTCGGKSGCNEFVFTRSWE